MSVIITYFVHRTTIGNDALGYISPRDVTEKVRIKQS
jgi:hypothetical protein